MIPLVHPTITDNDRLTLTGAITHLNLLDDELEVRRYEEAFAAYVGCQGAVAVNSGTSALMLALKVIRPERGNVASTTTYTCRAIINAIYACNLAPTFVDSHYNARAAQMTQHGGTILTHAFGRETKVDASRRPAIEDYTLSLGAVPPLRGEIGVCSTSRDKMISTGRGGIIFSNNTDLLTEIRELAYYDKHPNSRRNNYSLGITPMQAALGRSQLRQLPKFIQRRREIASVYTAVFDDHHITCPTIAADNVFFRYLISVPDAATTVTQLQRRGIEAGRGVYPPLHQHAGLPDDNYPGAMESVQHLVSIPIHPSLDDKQVAYIAEQTVQVCAP